MSSCIVFLIVFLWHDDEMTTTTKISIMKKTTKTVTKTMTITVMIKMRNVDFFFKIFLKDQLLFHRATQSCLEVTTFSCLDLASTHQMRSYVNFLATKQPTEVI